MTQPKKNIYLPFKEFKFFGIYVFAYTNKDGSIKKKTFQPVSELYKDIKNYMEPVLMEGKLWKPNGIQIDTSDISVIDVDIPEKCDILSKLLEDCKFYVKTRKGYHFYFKKENVLPRKAQLGVIDVNVNLWFVPKYYHEDTNEEYNYKLIKSECLVDMPKYAIDYVLGLIKVLPPVQKVALIKEERIIDRSYRTEKLPLEAMRAIYQVYYENNDFEKKDTWLSLACLGRNINNSIESCKMFDEYSRKSKTYASNDYESNRRTFYGKGDYIPDFNVNGVIFKCQKLNGEVFKTVLRKYIMSKYSHKIRKFDRPFIWDENDTAMFDSFVVSQTKVMTIKASYGLGKTFAFKKLIKRDFKGKRILFITYRKSLATAFHNDLRDRFGFKSYLEKSINVRECDRLIIQLDSIKHLREYDDIAQIEYFPGYDLVIMDEIEGLLNHFSYEKINQEHIFRVLTKILGNSPKILALDGDVGDRTYDFYKSLEYTAVYYENTRAPVKKHFIFNNDKEEWLNQIDDELKANSESGQNKGIVVVCMTATQTNELFAKYCETYKVAIHNSVEKNSEILRDVNTEWNKCDLVLYSPTVEAGVDFNIDNKFSKCFVSISNNSTTVRALFQMINRVRFYESNTIAVYAPENLKFETESFPVYFEEVKLNKYQHIEISPLATVLIHNEVEHINTRDRFISTMVRMLLEKGHTYELIEKPKPTEEELKELEELKEKLEELKEKLKKIEELKEKHKKHEEKLKEELKKLEKEAKGEPKPTKEELKKIKKLKEELKEKLKKVKEELKNIKEELKNIKEELNKLEEKPTGKKKEGELSAKEKILMDIVSAKCIKDIEYSNIISIQKQNKDITREQQHSLDKYIYRKVFKTDDVTLEFMKKHYRKLHVVKYYKRIMRIKNTNEGGIFAQLKDEACDTIKELIDLFGGSIDNGKLITGPHILLSDVRPEVISFMNKKSSTFQLDYNCYVNPEYSEASNRAFFLKVNKVLGDYGFAIDSKRHQRQNSEGEKENYYEVSVVHSQIIKEYLERSGVSTECAIDLEDIEDVAAAADADVE